MPAPRRTCAACAAILTLLVGEAHAARGPVSRAILAAAPPVSETSPAAQPAAEAPLPTRSPDLRGALDLVLPCGLRVLAARDLSLPVAAVVLAVEVGSEDDPPEYPGLVHALAYHLHQGNRELRPGEAIAATQDAGGAHFLATGPGQVRFESLVPSSRLGEVLYVESQRLRYPTVDRGRWEISLSWAASDVRPPSRLRNEQLAALHGAPGLGHEGRAINKALSGMVLGALSAQLASKFAYNRSTLIVVGPADPAEVVTQVQNLFRDLPPTQRSLPVRPPPPPRTPLAATGTPAATGNPAGNPPVPATGNSTPGKTGSGNPTTPGKAPPGKTSSGNPTGNAVAPSGATSATAPTVFPAAPGNLADTSDFPAATHRATILPPAGLLAAPTPVPAATGTPTPLPDPTPPPAATPPPGPRPNVFAWPVPPNPAAAMWAGALCRAINRQKRENDEARKARLACDFDPDPRRGALLLRSAGIDDPIAFVRARLARLATTDAPLLAAQAGFVAQALRLRVRTPLGLARQLAAAAATQIEAVPRDTPAPRELDQLTGLASLTGAPALTLAVEDALILTPGATP